MDVEPPTRRNLNPEARIEDARSTNQKTAENIDREINAAY